MGEMTEEQKRVKAQACRAEVGEKFPMKTCIEHCPLYEICKDLPR